ncbi:nucleotidyltransferase domain-containing protein [Amphibacillus sediminis]|uniref:nucleotidyltransferase domain-containing protein n=1 Tax=Amphibacillus sediminis TaxID=360185 RepID=UPI00083085FF|nr:nucleotidyltransferase domain-containing protein [Amphibacillus sediminis]
MYKHNDRIEVMSKIENFTKSLNGVQALLLVGSGSTGFRDRFSDLDLLVVVKNPEDVPTINKQLREYLQSSFCILKEKTYHHEEDIIVSCFFFNNYLELDLGVWSFNKIRATKPNWIVVFDQEKTVSDKLIASLNKLPQKDINETINDSLSFIWQFFRSAAVALKRGYFIKALKDIDFIRNQIIEIICLRSNIRYDFDKCIDQVDNCYSEKLSKTYQVNVNFESLQKTLFEVMNIYFEVINIKENMVVVERNRSMIHGFLKEILINH